MAAEYESVVCVKNEVFVFRIPPRPSNRGYRASDWKLDAPDWTGRLRVIAKGKDILLRLEDKVSGEEFAKCPVDSYPGVAVEPVMDSSRYFVIRIQEGERSAFIGIGFTDRSDSFDLNVALQDHFKWLKQEEELEKSSKNLDEGPKLDLSLKAGQTMKIFISGQSGAKSRPKPTPGSGAGGLLPPPPGPGMKILAPPGSSPTAGIQPSANPAASSSASLVDLFGEMNSASEETSDIGAAPGSKKIPLSVSSEIISKNDDDDDDTTEASKSAAAANSDSSGWGDFTSSHSSASNWVQF